MDMTDEHWWKVSLRLKLRQVSGDGFQDFFSTVMGKLHSDDYVRVRPYGAKGDKGCDGYRSSTGELFQCYGALNGDKDKVDYLIKKMDADFHTASAKLGAIMKKWHMVHNLVDGLPVHAVEKLKELEAANPKIKFGFVGLEGFEERVSALKLADKIELLGPAATNKDAQDLQISELKDLIAGIVLAGASGVPAPGELGPVPVDKLEINKLPPHWRSLISGGWQNAPVAADYFDKHHDPLIGEKIAELFRARYQYLKAQHLSPATIMDSLYEYVTGVGTVNPARQVAAQALLAYLFESCDIFENAVARIIHAERSFGLASVA